MLPSLLIITAMLILFAVVLIGRKYANRNIAQRTAEETIGLARKGKIVLLDVRTDGERALRSIPNSLHIPLSDLAERTDELEAHRDKEIVCYCQSGARSIAAADQLGKLGFNAASLKGGIISWDRVNG